MADPLLEKRKQQVQHLIECGPRCVLEALIAVDEGQALDDVLADFERLYPQTYKITSLLVKGST
jgi:hypothetical protein